MEISIRWNICRICLDEERKNDKSAAGGRMQHIFSEDNKLVNQIYECSGVPMKPNDSLPDKICRKCILVLKYAVYFRKSCRDSNEYLQSIIRRTKSASSLFKQERNTESLIETATDGTDMDYMQDHDDLLSFGKSDVSNTEKEAKQVTKHTHNKRKQTHKILHREKHIKLLELSTSCVGKEPTYTMTDCEDEDEEREDIVDRIIVHEDEDDVAEIDEEIIEHAGEALNQIITTDVEKATNTDSGTIHDDNRLEKCAKKLHKVSKTNLQNTYMHFTKLDSQHIITSVVDCDAGDDDDDDDDEDEDEDEDEDVDEVEETNVSGGNIDEKSPEAELMQDVKSEESDNSLFYIINKDNPDNNHNNEVGDCISSDENVEFIPLEEEEIHHIEEEHEEDDDVDNQSQVTSTVVTKEEVDIEDANSNSSRNSQEIDAEYVIDEYVIDDPLVHSNVSISAKNPRNIATLSMDDKEQQLRRGHAVFGRKQSEPQYRHVASSTTNSTQQQVIVCDLCGNNFTNRQLMNAHMKIHRQEKTHECELCFKRFITACNLQAHMRIHTGEKPFECKYCGRRFTDRSTHIRHERIHTNEKPFSCDHCGKAFALATTLQAHLKVHTGERPYRCQPCAKSFKLPHQLKAHQNTHLHKAVEQMCSEI